MNYREVRRRVRRSKSARVDETGWKLRGQTRWLWTAAAERATLFHLGRSRSARDLCRLLGRDYSGIVTSDRWSAYQIYPRRQLCWAHLARNFEGLALRGGDARAFCRNLHDHADALWTFTHEAVEPTNNQAERALRRAVLCVL